MRRIFLQLALVVFSVSATLALLEVGVRIFRPQRLDFWDSRSIRRLQTTVPHFVENIPNGRATFIGVPVAINSYGMREREVAVPKPHSTIRILAVGDSITFGYGVPLEYTYPKILEKLLNTDPNRNTQFEVLNGATLGGSLSDYRHFLSERAERLQPDIVLIGLNLNDIVVYSATGAVTGGPEGRKGRFSPAHKISRFLLRHSQLYMLCYDRMKSKMYSFGLIDVNKSRGMNFMTMAPPSAYQEKAWESSLRMLSTLVDFCRGRNYQVGLVVFPMQMQLSKSELQVYRDDYHLNVGAEALSGEPQKRLIQFASEKHISIVDLLPAYRALAPEELYVRNEMIHADPDHPSIKGHQVAAEEIARTLKGSFFTAAH